MKINKRRFLAAWLLALSVSAAVCGQSAPCLNNKCLDESGGWELTLPAKWIQKPSVDGAWEFATPDEWLTARLWNSAYEPGNALNESIMATELHRFVKTPEWSKIGDAGILNGMQVIENSGTGKIGEQTVNFDLAALRTSRRWVFLLTITTPDGFKNNLSEFSAFFGSIKRK